jgi:DNA-binding Xre family transcriptional regulator
MIKIKVQELMNTKGWSITDLMRKANIAYSTAHHLVRGTPNGISFEVLSTLCEVFDVEVKDILEYVPNK